MSVICKKHLQVLSFLVLLLTSQKALATFPMVVNLNRNSFGGGAQTWAITQDDLGRMYFGNTNGLLRYNSHTWEHTGVGNGSTIRSLLLSSTHKGRLYAGAFDELGYFYSDTLQGNLKFKSLTELIPIKYRSFKETWGIHESGSDVWFCADNIVFHLCGNKMYPIEIPGHISASTEYHGGLLVAVESKGIMEIKGHKVRFLPHTHALSHDKICELLPYKENVMAVTEYKGLWEISDYDTRRLGTRIDDFLLNNQVFCAAVSASGKRYAFGTVGNGVAVIDFDSDYTAFSNIATGMQNNTVLSMRFDRDCNLWLGLDNGIDLALTNSPFSNLLGSNLYYGAGYVSLIKDNLLYLGTNQGLYIAPYPLSDSPSPPDLTQVLKGQIWDIAIVGDKVFVCSDAGLFYGNGNMFNAVAGVPGCWCVKPLRHHAGYFLASTYTSFYLVNISEPGVAYPLSGYADIGGKFVEDNDGKIWISHWLKGIYSFFIDTDNKQIRNLSFYNSKHGLPSDRNNSISYVRNNLIIGSENGFYTLKNGRLTHYREIMELDSVNGPTRLHESPDGDLWCIAPQRIAFIPSPSHKHLHTDSISYTQIRRHLIPGFENLNFVSDKEVIISAQDGFYHIDMRHSGMDTKPGHLFFSKIIADGDSLLYSAPLNPGNGKIKFDYGFNSILFNFVLPEYRDADAVSYSCFLKNYDSDWSGFSSSDSKEYTRLYEGDYVLYVKAYNALTDETQQTELHFTITPPWYRSMIAKCIYSLLILLSVWYGYNFISALLKRKSARLAEKKERELDDLKRRTREENLHKDFEIAELKGRQLEQDIKHKTEELSNITMNVVRKNEILLEISSHLSKIGHKLPAEAFTEINHVQQLIKQNINHDDDWRNFVHNFDAAYEDFTKKLLSMHPSLTRTELRVSCYIRMGLSSKDIAPLFNISHRSVEMTRYRLRKKLNLDRAENLTDYLQKIN